MNEVHVMREINALDSCRGAPYREAHPEGGHVLTAELLAAALVLTPVDGCQGGRPFVRVSLEWRARSVPGALADTAREEVETIWRRLGVAVHWTSRHTPGGRSPAVHVIVSDEASVGSRGQSLPKLGWIEFWGDHPGTLLRVSAAAALAAVNEARTIERLASGQPVAALRFTAARMVGRAIAHELGHYLLRSRAHTASGLMRPVFSAHEATVPFLDRYRLDRRQVTMLRRQPANTSTGARCGG
jgi:hypothetical protein